MFETYATATTAVAGYGLATNLICMIALPDYSRNTCQAQATGYEENKSCECLCALFGIRLYHTGYFLQLPVASVLGLWAWEVSGLLCCGICKDSKLTNRLLHLAWQICCQGIGSIFGIGFLAGNVSSDPSSAAAVCETASLLESLHRAAWQTLRSS